MFLNYQTEAGKNGNDKESKTIHDAPFVDVGLNGNLIIQADELAIISCIDQAFASSGCPLSAYVAPSENGDW